MDEKTAADGQRRASVRNLEATRQAILDATIAQLDEALFAIPELLDFTAAVSQGTPRRPRMDWHRHGRSRGAGTGVQALTEHS